MSLTLAVIACFAHDLYVGAIDVSKWYKLYMLQTPYDRQTIRGYVISYIHETVTVTCLALNIACNLSLFTVPILYMEAFCVDLIENLKQLSPSKRSDRRSTSDSQLISNIVEFHEDIIGCACCPYSHISLSFHCDGNKSFSIFPAYSNDTHSMSVAFCFSKC